MIRRAAMMLFLLAVIAAPWSHGRALAEEIDATDAQAIREAVQLQLNAFSQDNAAAAFELATTSVRTLFGDADSLLQVIKRHYPPVYRHRDAVFSMPEIVSGHALQLVRLTDTDNLVWVAIYVMQQETDGSWRIDGCKLVKTNSVSI